MVLHVGGLHGAGVVQSGLPDVGSEGLVVVGAAAATTLVAATEGQLDKAVYNGKVEAPAAEAV